MLRLGLETGESLVVLLLYLWVHAIIKEIIGIWLP